MDERDRDLLGQIVIHAETAVAYASRRGADWTSVPETVDAVIMRITQVAECARRLSPETAAAIGSVPWAALRGMRNRIVHDYAKVDLAVLKTTVERDLPAIAAAVRAALPSG